MRPLRRALTALGAAAALVLGAGAAGAAPAPPPVPVPQLDWEDCGDGFECATAEVPLDHARPRLGTTTLSLVRKPATGEDRIGSLFSNPGGPGGSGVDFLRAAAEIFAGVNDRFDLVSWDPRATLGSDPRPCLTDEQREAQHARAQAFPTSADLPQLTRDAAEFVAGCMRAGANALRYVGTENTARDLDLLRRAVGDDRLTYLGFSYGTYLGATYASLFPNRARALVLDGAVDPAQYADDPLTSDLLQARGFDVALGRFLDWCETSPACLFEGGRPAFDQLIADIGESPLPAILFEDPRPVRQIDALYATVLALYARQNWPVLGDTLFLAQLGDGSFIQFISDIFRGRNPDGTFDPSYDAFPQISCLDRAFPRSVRAFDRAARRAATGVAPFTGPYNVWSGLSCGLWPIRGNTRFAGPFRYPAGGDRAPVLVVGTTFDPATPYAGSLAMTAQLGNARLLTMEGDGHTAYGGNSTCIDDAVDAYLEDLVLPPAGTVCRQEVEDPAPLAAGAGGSRSEVARGLAARTAVLRPLPVERLLRSRASLMR